MGRKNERLILAITPWGNRIAGNVTKTCKEYDMSKRYLYRLIESGALFRDNKTCFDEVLNGKEREEDRVDYTEGVC